VNDVSSGKKEAGFLRRHRGAMLALAALALVVAFLVWTWRYLRPGTWRFYTDEIGLRRLAADVEPRPVLWGRAAPLDSGFSAPSDAGRAAFSPDGTRLVFARGGTNGNSDLFLAERIGAAWSAPRPLPALNSLFGEMTPAFSGDGRYLFFASDRPGGFGGLDIWVARWDGTTFAWPLPLDAGVNSPCNETSPSPSSDGTLLYFASDRPREAGVVQSILPTTGRADYDIFYAARIPPGVTNTEIERAQNILYSLRERALSDTNVMARLGGTPASEAAVDRGLAWLAKTQETNGSWSIARSGGQEGHDVAATAFALLAFYGRSDRHDRPGPYRETVRRGLDWLVGQVNPLTGDLRGGASTGKKNLYDQCIGTLALAEAYGLTHDSALFEPLQSAVFFLVDAQHAQGGWRYAPNEDRDLSVSGWAIMAIKSAELSGLHVQRKAVEGIRAILRDCSAGAHGGQFLYQPTGGRETKAMQATGFFCSQLMGLSPNSRKAVEAARNIGTEGAMDDVYFLYYGTLADYQFQGPLWRTWRDRVFSDMLAAQQADGSWVFTGGHGQAAGRVVATALVTLSLQAHYRYTPLYGLGYEPPSEAGVSAGADYDQLPDMPNYEPAHRFYGVINTAADETDPWITPRGDFLYFASNRREGQGGFDLYRVRATGRWNLGVENLGPDINTPADETGPATRDAGFGLVFVSGAVGEGKARLMAAPSRRVWRDRDYATMPAPGWVFARYPVRLALAGVALLGFVIVGVVAWRRRS
jgi:hypothetical protein